MTVGFSGTDSNFRALTKALKDANESLMFGTVTRMNHVVLTLVMKNYLEKLEKEAKDIESDIKETLNGYYMDMVNGYYEKYFGIEVWWLPDFPDLASKLLLRIPKKAPCTTES